jgi:hypothetical protein
VTSRMETSPQVYARVGGVLYLTIIVLGIFAEGFVRSTLVAHDAATTAHNIMAAQSLWSIGAAANLIVVLCAVPLLLIEYVLLRPVSRNLALLAVFFNLVSLAVEAVSKLFYISILSALRSADHLTGFGPGQIEGLAYLALSSYDIAFNIALIFFGFTCIVNGYLIFKSRYFPPAIGVLMQIAGLCYLVACFAALFATEFFNLISPAILVPCLIGELSLCLWLLVKGVDLPKWIAHPSNA